MLTSTKAVPKPKRPLSGYNLFYRYKRNKVVEATARTDSNDDEHRNKAIIHAVLTALPGLEDVPPFSPLFDLPPARLNEFRAAKIRAAMEGKLFPNENARRRIHCKVHGMGFVEMGQEMRQMWGQADKLTKDVFCELAEVGRARYRRLAAEYKLSCVRPGNVKSETPNCGVHTSAENSALKSAMTVNKSKEAVRTGSSRASLAAAAAVDPVSTGATAKAKASETSPIPPQARSSSDPMLEAQSIWATKNTPVAGTASSESKKGSRPNCGRRVSLDPYYFQAPVQSEAQRYGGGYLSDPLAFKTTMNPTANVASEPTEKIMRPQRRVSSTAAELNLCDDSLFEPLPIDAATGPAAMDLATSKTSTGHGRRVSTDMAPQLNWPAIVGNGTWTPKTSSGHGRRASTDVFPMLYGSMGTVSAPTTAAMRDGSAGPHSANANLKGLKTNLELQKVELRNAIQNLKYKIIQNNTLLSSDMRFFPQGSMVPQAQGKIVRGTPRLETVTSGNPSIRPGHVAAANDANPSGGNGPAKRGAIVQGSAEFVDELAAAIDHHGIAFSAIDRVAVRRSDSGAVPMPASIDLKNHRARMA